MKEKSCRIVVLISGSGTNLQALIEAIDRDKIRGKIVAVISNRPDAAGLKRADKAKIPTITLDHRQFSSRALFDHQLLEQIQNCQPDLVVLAGFMRILSPDLVEQFLGRMLNIHPSLLPKYRGLQTHKRVLESGDAIHGASVHFVTPDLDGGPIVLQATLTLHADHTAGKLAQEILPLEHIIYPQAVSWFCDGRLQCFGHQIVFDKEKLLQPLQLENI